MAPDATERGPAEAKTLASLSLITLKWTKYLIVSTKYLSWCMPLSHGVFFLFQSQPQWITELPEPRRCCTHLQKGTECFKSAKAVCSSRGSSEVHLKKIKLKIKYFPSCNKPTLLIYWVEILKLQSFVQVTVCFICCSLTLMQQRCRALDKRCLSTECC